MKKVRIAIFVAVSGYLASAQVPIAISGRVVTPRAKPVAGIIVRCPAKGLIDTTGQDGGYSLIFQGTVATTSSTLFLNRPRLENGRLLFSVTGTAERVEAAVFSVRGQQVGMVFSGMLRPGNHAIPLFAQP